MNIIPGKFFLDDVLDSFITAKEMSSLKCDIYEKEGRYYIVVDVPSIKKKDLDIDYDKGYLTITISKKEEKEDESEDKTYYRKERYSFEKEVKRSFYVGDIDSEKIKAEFEDGTLTIMLPKKEEISSRKKIEIE